jgi:hypothetical protein
MANIRIAPRNFWDLMTLSGSVAPNTGFEYVNTQNTDRSSFWRSPDATNQSLKGSLASGSITINCAFLFRHHCHGGSVRFRAFSNNNWTGTTLVDTGVVAIYTPISTGYDHGYADTSSADTHDPLGIESPFYVYFNSASGVKSVQWDFSSKSTTYGYDYWEAGRPFIGNYFEPAVNPSYGMNFGVGDNSVVLRTIGGSKQGSRGGRWATLQMDLDSVDESEMPTWIDIMKICQATQDVAVSVFPGFGGRQERDHTINGTFANLDVLGRQVSRLTKRIQIEEN